MATERYETILQLSSQGADRVIADINRIMNALKGPGGTGATAFDRIDAGVLQGVQSQRPKTYDRITGLLGQQELAQRKLTDAIQREARLRADPDTAAGKLRVAENATLAAAIRENKARQSLAEAVHRALPEVQQQAARERERRASNARWDAEESRVRQRQLAAMRADAIHAFGGNVEQQRQARADLVRTEREMAAIRKRELAAMRAKFTEAFSQMPSDTALSQSEINAMLQRPVRQPGDTDKVFRARELLADAQIRQAVAQSNLADSIRRAEMGEGASKQALRDAVHRSTIAYDVSSRSVVDSQRRLSVAIQNETIVHAQNTRRSIREDFITGFRGQRQAPYAEQIGQALKFSVFYGTAYKMLFGLTQTLQATMQEGVQFQQGMTDLAIATGRPKEELDQIANQLSQSAVRAGFAPSQGVEIGARSLGLYGATDSGRLEQDRVMAISSRVVNQLAVGAKKPPVELQGDIAAIAQALGLGAEGQFRIADLDAYMTKRFGVAQGSTLETVAQSASVGKAAGFSDEQLFAIAADMISRTGQTPSAVAGFMAQIFSRGGEGSLVDVAKRQGVDPNQDLAQIISQLSQIYKSASGPEQAQLSAAFGRGKIQNAAVALLSDYDEVLMRAAKAQEDASGEADRQYKLRMGNIGGQLAQTQGVMREFASLFGESGMLDVVGAGILTFRELLEAVNGLLKLWNLLPNGIQDTIIGLGLFVAALRTAAGSATVNSLLAARGVGQIGRLAGPVMPGAGIAVAGGASYAAGTRVLASSATGAVVPVASRAGLAGLATAGAASMGMVLPIAAAIGGLLAIGALKNSSDRMRAAQESATDVLTRPSITPDSTSGDFQARAGELRSLANQNREATGWFMNLITAGQANNAPEATARRLESEARRMSRIAARLSATESRAGGGDSSVFKSLASEDLKSGIDALQNSGATASEQLIALRDVLFGTADAARAAEQAFDRGQFAEKNATGVIGAARRGLKGFEFTANVPGSSRTGAMPRTVNTADLLPGLEEYLTGAEAQRRLNDALAEVGVDSLADLDSGTADRVAEMVGSGVADALLGPWMNWGGSGQVSAVQKRINRAVARYLRNQGTEVQDLLSGTSRLTAEDATAAAQLAVQLSEQALGGMADVDFGGRNSELRGRIRTLRRLQRRTDDPIGVIAEAIAAARKDIARNQFDELERLRRIAQRSARSKAEIAQIGRSFLEREIRAAVRGRDADLLVQILEQAGKGAARIAQDAIQDAIDVINAARQISAALGDIGNTLGNVVQGQAAAWRQSGAAANNVKIQKQIDELENLGHDIGTALPGRGDQDLYTSGSDSGNPLLDKDSAAEKDTPAQIAAARAAAFAARSGGQMAAARAAITQARASLADAKKNTVEYWNAMGQLWEAQNQLTDAVLAYKHNLGALRIDITNPLAEARLAVRDATRRLHADRGKAPDVRAQDRVDLREARANEEATKFQQRLQAVQTADELGRISHAKYINYLENEKRRLERIKNRTFQQQEQLNQIDRLMQDAARQMAGQFNLGDIKLPTPYQVRRYIEEQSSALTAKAAQRSAAGAAAGSVMTNYLVFQGYDPDQIKNAVKDVVGKSTRVLNTAPRRR